MLLHFNRLITFNSLNSLAEESAKIQNIQEISLLLSRSLIILRVLTQGRTEPDHLLVDSGVSDHDIRCPRGPG